MEKITVTIITLNEGKNIRDCLESVRWADEIIVSDSGSTDGTIAICNAYGARVFNDRWLGFGAQKNLAATRAANKWILNIDADERITPELKTEVAGLDGSLAGYYISRKNYFGDKWIRRCGWYPDYNLRLYRKDLGGFSVRAVHEAVSVTGQTGRLSNPMTHYTYRDVADYLVRMERYSTLAAEEMFRSGKKAGRIDRVARPAFTFFKMYVMRLGFLEGQIGFTLSRLYALYTAAKYAKLRAMTAK